MTAACDLVSVELRLDRIEAELASELPPHVRMFAQRYARGEAAPPAPAVLRRRVTVASARAALAHPFLADRGLALLRLVAPIAIDDEPAVAAARAEAPSWAALAAVIRARDAVCEAWFGRSALEVMHRLHGVAGGASTATEATATELVVPAAIAGWREVDGVVLGLEDAWRDLAARHGVTGAVRFVRADGARPRAFVVEPGREVIVVVPARVAAPAERFAVLHELGHAIAGLGAPAGIPRVLDEAVASRVARTMEEPGSPWFSPLAMAARHRRHALARALDRLERGLPAFGAPGDARPPWALWHDAGAQASYVAAEGYADAMGDGGLLGALARARAEIDRRDTGL